MNTDTSIATAVKAVSDEVAGGEVYAQRTAISAVGNVCKVFAGRDKRDGIVVSVYDMAGGTPRRLNERDWK